MLKRSRNAVLGFIMAGFCSCTSTSNLLNPFYETPPPEAYLGEKNDRALSGTAERSETARAALEAMATYRRAHDPQPTYPVVQPAVVRLMWVPDHLNKSGDMVPSHYYYLKVLSDRWAVQDSFELESQLGPKTDSSNVPFINK
jgi:hypothetical protein